jgi:hypothetical protein
VVSDAVPSGLSAVPPAGWGEHAGCGDACRDQGQGGAGGGQGGDRLPAGVVVQRDRDQAGGGAGGAAPEREAACEARAVAVALGDDRAERDGQQGGAPLDRQPPECEQREPPSAGQCKCSGQVQAGAEQGGRGGGDHGDAAVVAQPAHDRRRDHAPEQEGQAERAGGRGE